MFIKVCFYSINTTYKANTQFDTKVLIVVKTVQNLRDINVCFCHLYLYLSLNLKSSNALL